MPYFANPLPSIVKQWSNKTRYKKAQWIMQRLMALMLILGALAFQHADTTTPSLSLIVSWFTLISFQTYISLMLFCGIALMIIGELGVIYYIVLTLPIALYIAYTTVAQVFYLQGNLQGIVFLVVLYVMLMVSYWGYE